jgi:general secretion pathway protein K
LNPKPAAASEHDPEAGYALVLVLVGIALLSLIVVSVLQISSRSVQDISADLARAQLADAADAGVSEAELSLVDLRPSMRWPIDGTPRYVTFDGVPVTIIVESESGKIDLNGANRDLIVGLFAAAGLDQTSANTMADRVMDWREPGNLKRLNGAKAPDYRAAELPYGPRDGPFQSISELQLVLGMTPTLYEKRARGEIAPETGEQGPNAVVQIPGLPGTVFTILSQARFAERVVLRRETVLFTGNPKNPFWILAWD